MGDMLERLLHRNVLSAKDEEEIALKLSRDLAPFQPQEVFYVANGGTRIGETIASSLGLPATGIDMSYATSRPLERLPAWLAGVLWPFKELTYRLSSPRLNNKPTSDFETTRAVLVDDSASTGRTLKRAIDLLEDLGFERCNIQTAVIRCGAAASDVVDHFETTAPVLFSRG